MESNDLRKLKKKVSAEVGAHPDEYKDAGMWLDEFCSEKEWRKRQKAALKAAQALYAEEPTDGRASCISDLKERVKRRQRISLQMCLSDALHYWLKRYEGYESVDAEDGRNILLISLLLLEPDSKKVAGTLTQFTGRPWMTDDEIDSRAWAGMPLRLGEYWGKWKVLIRSALAQVKLLEQIEAAKADSGDSGLGPLPVNEKYINQVPWDENDPAYEFNTEAIKKAKKIGRDHDIPDLKKMDWDKIRKLLRRSDCTIKFMSCEKPRPHGKVNKEEWAKYLRNEVAKAENFDKSVDNRAKEISEQLE